MATRDASRTSATESIWLTIAIGVLFNILGVIAIVVVALEEDPPLPLELIGWVLSAIGGACLMVGLIGYGVFMGLQAHDASRS